MVKKQKLAKHSKTVAKALLISTLILGALSTDISESYNLTTAQALNARQQITVQMQEPSQQGRYL